MAKTIQQCRICGNPDLISVLNLGEQALTGVFPRLSVEPFSRAPLELVKCSHENNSNACGLVQLKHSCDSREMYGENYGYRSGLNSSMVRHLRHRMDQLIRVVSLQSGDMVVDIGSNDGTLLRSYPFRNLKLVGIDPLGSLRNNYPRHIDFIADFFSAEALRKQVGKHKAKIVTSFAMFYDIESPLDFMREVYEILDDDGIWMLEQSYLPQMLEHNSFDTICHEHLEYYALKQIKWMTDAAGFKIVDVEFSDANGGSFAVTVAKRSSRMFQENTKRVELILSGEHKRGLATLRPYEEFRDRIVAQASSLKRFIDGINARGQKVLGYGASTKGNVILQYCGFTRRDIPAIADVNPDKWGRCTPGTGIPIISEQEARAESPDYFLVLPWHFKDHIIEREKDYIDDGGTLVFPLPNIEVVTGKSAVTEEATA